MSPRADADSGFKLEHDPRFLERVARAREELRAGRGIPWQEVAAEGEPGSDESRAADKPRRKRRRKAADS